MTATLGLDVGGAHLKAALVDRGRVLDVRQIVCPLWQGFDKLDVALEVAAPLIRKADSSAITMTGELSDIFDHREQGVELLVSHLDHKLPGRKQFWMGRAGFGNASQAITNYAGVASTNFLATAAYVATRCPNALLIDMGSTTTDIIPISGGRPTPRALTDADRLMSGELVYTGLTRTALMAIVHEAPFRGVTQPLCREYFATMADVRRVLGDLPDSVDVHATADGKGKSMSESIARLARMFGRDGSDGTLDDWRASALAFSDAQLNSIEEACRLVERESDLLPDSPVILAGLGAEVPSVLPALAHRLGCAFQSFCSLVDADADVALWSTRCAPAVAVALLASAQ